MGFKLMLPLLVGLACVLLVQTATVATTTKKPVAGQTTPATTTPKKPTPVVATTTTKKPIVQATVATTAKKPTVVIATTTTKKPLVAQTAATTTKKPVAVVATSTTKKPQAAATRKPAPESEYWGDYENPARGEKPIEGRASCSRKGIIFDGSCEKDKASFIKIGEIIKEMIQRKANLEPNDPKEPPNEDGTPKLNTGPACKFDNADFEPLKEFLKVPEDQKNNLCLWSGIGKGDGFNFVDKVYQPNCFRLETTVFGRYLVINYPRDIQKTDDGRKQCCEGFRTCHLPNFREGKISSEGIISNSHLFYGLWSFGSRAFAAEIGAIKLRAFFSNAGTTPRPESKLAGPTFAKVELPQLKRNTAKITGLEVFIVDDPKNQPPDLEMTEPDLRKGKFHCLSPEYDVLKKEVEAAMGWAGQDKIKCEVVKIVGYKPVPATA